MSASPPTAVTAAATADARATADSRHPSSTTPRPLTTAGSLEYQTCQHLAWKEPKTPSQKRVAQPRRGESTPRQVSARPTTTAAAVAADARAAATSRHHSPRDPMETAAGDPPPPPLLGPVLGTLPDLVFQHEVLRWLGPRALASLAGAGRGCAAAVAATALMQWAKRVKRTPPEHLGYYLPPLCLKEACSYAARCGNREVLEWLHNTGCPWDAKTCAYAARSGHLRVLQWMREQHCPWDSLTPAYAAAGGHLAVLQWAQEQGCPWNYWRTCDYAAMSGHLEVLQWMRENDATDEAWDERLVRAYAAGPRKQEVLTWLDQLSAQ